MGLQLNSNEIAEILPHRYPFALVDRITDGESGVWAKGIKCVSVGEPFFCGHFPQKHVMPGVLILEALAQVGAVAILSLPENRGKIALFGGVKNARFFAADATAWIREAADAGQKADVVFMDPPREGSTPAFLESVARMAPKRIVYVSCNPETMARDLALLTQKGYRAEGFTPVDMFPHSAHCEVVCALSRTSSGKR